MGKKDFKAELNQGFNPAMAFISTPEPKEELRAIPEQESKTKRFQLLIRPSTYEALKRRADEEGDSVNNLINTILEKEIKDNGKY